MGERVHNQQVGDRIWIGTDAPDFQHGDYREWRIVGLVRLPDHWTFLMGLQAVQRPTRFAALVISSHYGICRSDEQDAP